MSPRAPVQFPASFRWSRRARRVFVPLLLLLGGSFLLVGLGRASAASVTLAWDANVETNLLGYRLYYGTASRSYSTLITVTAPTTTASATTLTAGRTYYFAVTAFDSTGAESDFSAEVVYTPGSGGGGSGGGGSTTTSPLTITLHGAGSVTPNLNGQSLIVGHSYQLTAIPATGSRFVAWGGGVTGTSPALTFVMSSNLVIDATFETDVAWLAQGTYYGLFAESDEVRHERSGNFVLTATSRGTYSGKLQVGGRKFGMKGLVASDGKGTNVILRPLMTPLTVEVSLAAGRATGRVSDGTWSATLAGDRQFYHARTNPAPFALNYTLIIPADQNVLTGPRGDGYGTVKVDRKGMATFVGMLADGTKATQKVALSQEGYWPFYLGVYKGGGSVLGWLGVTNNLDEVGGLLSWIKPSIYGRYYAGGFTNESLVAGSSYVPPTPEERLGAAQPLDVTCAGANLPANITGHLMVLPNGKMVSDPDQLFKYGMSPSSGLFRGTVLDASTGKPRVFSGVKLQKWSIGRGLVLGTNAVGQVYTATP
jgi:hypothetical protein